MSSGHFNLSVYGKNWFLIGGHVVVAEGFPCQFIECAVHSCSDRTVSASETVCVFRVDLGASSQLDTDGAYTSAPRCMRTATSMASSNIRRSQDGIGSACSNHPLLGVDTARRDTFG